MQSFFFYATNIKQLSLKLILSQWIKFFILISVRAGVFAFYR